MKNRAAVEEGPELPYSEAGRNWPTEPLDDTDPDVDAEGQESNGLSPRESTGWTEMDGAEG